MDSKNNVQDAHPRSLIKAYIALARLYQCHYIDRPAASDLASSSVHCRATVGQLCSIWGFFSSADRFLYYNWPVIDFLWPPDDFGNVLISTASDDCLQIVEWQLTNSRTSSVASGAPNIGQQTAEYRAITKGQSPDWLAEELWSAASGLTSVRCSPVRQTQMCHIHYYIGNWLYFESKRLQECLHGCDSPAREAPNSASAARHTKDGIICSGDKPVIGRTTIAGLSPDYRLIRLLSPERERQSAADQPIIGRRSKAWRCRRLSVGNSLNVTAPVSQSKGLYRPINIKISGRPTIGFNVT